MKILIFIFFFYPYFAFAKDIKNCQSVENFSLRNQFGDQISLKQILAKNKAKLVILSLFQTTCAPCLEEIKYLNKIQRTNSASTEKLFDLVLIDSREERNVTIEFINKYSIDSDFVLSDPYGKIDSLFDIKLVPKLIILDSFGNWIYSSEGKELNNERISNNLEKTIKQFSQASPCKIKTSKK